MNVVVTGAGGLIGQETCATLLRAGCSVHALARRRFALAEGSAALRVTLAEDLAAMDRLEDVLAGAEAVVHLAARVHRVAEGPRAAAGVYTRDVQMTRALALAAHRVGVRRLVFLSSIKALGDRSPSGALARNSIPNPVDPYGRGKLAAERELERISASTGLEVAVIRAPLVYGARAGANFRQMVCWVRRGVPLPLAGVRNRRSIVSIDNLTQAIFRCLGPLEGKHNVFHISDSAAISTPGLLRHVAAGLNVPARLFTIRTETLEWLCDVVGRADIAARLLLSLEFEVEDSFAALRWRPGVETRDGIIRAVRGMRF